MCNSVVVHSDGKIEGFGAINGQSTEEYGCFFSLSYAKSRRGSRVVNKHSSIRLKCYIWFEMYWNIDFRALKIHGFSVHNVPTQ